MNQHIDIKPEVRQALKAGQAVVALESTIISHGMPYPENINMAKEVEAIIRKAGAIPATVAVINGMIKIGLDDEDLLLLSQSKDIMKVSKRDIGYVVSKQQHGATTVSATMLIAAMAGIKVFATGGIGGVHRGASETFDISRDLEEIAQVDVCVVCAGAKSILDLGLTLEYMETKGVEIIGYQTDELPAFYTRTSGYPLDLRLDSPGEIAALMRAKWSLGVTGGIVVANPISSTHSMDPDLILQTIDQATEAAKKQGITGKALTPFLLSWIKKNSQGESLKANLELVYANARLAADIAIAYSELQS